MKNAPTGFRQGREWDKKTQQPKRIIPSLPDPFKTAHDLASEVLAELVRLTQRAA